MLKIFVLNWAWADAPAGGLGGAGGALSPLFPLLLMGLVFYFLIIRPQSKKARQHQKFLEELKKGDMVITQGGIIGTVRTISDKLISLEVDDDVTFKILRSQILDNANSLKEEKQK